MNGFCSDARQTILDVQVGIDLFVLNYHYEVNVVCFHLKGVYLLNVKIMQKLTSLKFLFCLTSSEKFKDIPFTLK